MTEMRAERPEESAAIRTVHQQAFHPRPNQARLVELLSDPRYYRRFGFVPASTYRPGNEHGASDAFIALELQPGALRKVEGLVRYAPVQRLVRHWAEQVWRAWSAHHRVVSALAAAVLPERGHMISILCGHGCTWLHARGGERMWAGAPRDKMAAGVAVPRRRKGDDAPAAPAQRDPPGRLPGQASDQRRRDRHPQR